MSEESNALLEEMQAIKKLLMLQTLALGYKQKHLASVLGVSEATLSRMMPTGFSKEISKIAKNRSLPAED